MAPLWPGGIRRQELQRQRCCGRRRRGNVLLKSSEKAQLLPASGPEVAPWLLEAWSPSPPILQRLVCLDALSLMGLTR